MGGLIRIFRREFQSLGGGSAAAIDARGGFAGAGGTGLDDRSAMRRPRPGAAGLAFDGVWQANREQGCLARGEARGRLAEVGLRRRLGTEDAGAPFDDVEVDLEDAPLRPGQLDGEGQRDLDDLAQVALGRATGTGS